MHRRLKILKINQHDPDPSVIVEIVRYIKEGKVIAYPTDTFYGLGADIYNEYAIKRIFQIKGRVYDKPILILISKKEELEPLIIHDRKSDYINKLIKYFWPGPLTMIFKASGKILPILTGYTGKIGIRLPDHPFCRILVEKLRRPVTATSANLSGMPGLNDPQKVMEVLNNKIDVLVDGGVTDGLKASTVVDATGEKPVIIREGMISLKKIQKIVDT